MRKAIVLIGFSVLAFFASPHYSAQAQVSIAINLPAPPSLVIIPGTPVAYASSLPSNYFFYGGQYYVFADSAWHAGPTYNGPWAVVPPAYIPAPLLSVPVKYYRRPPPHWKHWRRDVAPQWDRQWGNEWKKAEKDEQKEWKRAEKEEAKERKEAEKDARNGHKKQNLASNPITADFLSQARGMFRCGARTGNSSVPIRRFVAFTK